MMESARKRSSLGGGFHALSSGRVLVLLVLTTTGLAVLPALALWPAIHSTFGETLAGDHVLRNHPSFGPEDVLEFFYEKSDAIAGASRVAIGAGLLGVLLQILYAGGLVETLGRDSRPTLGGFFAGAFSNFWHNIKCFLIFLLLGGVAIGAWLGGTGALARKIFEETPPGAASSLFFRIARLAIAFLLYALLSLFHDFARLARRYQIGIGAWRGYGFAGRLLARAKLPAMGLFAFWLIAGGTAWLALIALEWGTAATTAAAVLLHTLLQIAAVTVRSGVRLAAWGSYIALADQRGEPSEPALAAPHAGASTVAEPSGSIDLISEAPLL